MNERLNVNNLAKSIKAFGSKTTLLEDLKYIAIMEKVRLYRFHHKLGGACMPADFSWPLHLRMRKTSPNVVGLLNVSLSGVLFKGAQSRYFELF